MWLWDCQVIIMYLMHKGFWFTCIVCLTLVFLFLCLTSIHHFKMKLMFLSHNLNDPLAIPRYQVRNASLRSLPPSSSSSPSSTNRYWDREGRSTLSNRTLSDSDAFNKSLASSSISDKSDDSCEGNFLKIKKESQTATKQNAKFDVNGCCHFSFFKNKKLSKSML